MFFSFALFVIKNQRKLLTSHSLLFIVCIKNFYEENICELEAAKIRIPIGPSAPSFHGRSFSETVGNGQKRIIISFYNRKEPEMNESKHLVINPLWCKGCGICAAFCPKSALEIVNEKARLKEDGGCILCGQCELRCPDYAIYLQKNGKEDT